MFLHALWLAASPAAGDPVRANDVALPGRDDPRDDLFEDLTPGDLVWGTDPTIPVVGGDPVPQGRWDDAVGIVFDGNFVGCTGTLIGPEVVLTAGHCVVGSNVTHVVVGSKDSASNQGEVLAVDQVHEYPNSQRTLDIAVLTLRTASSYPPRAMGIECVLEDLVDGAEVQIVGFGATTEQGNDRNTRLNEVTTEVVDADCDQQRVNGMLSGCIDDVSPGGELAAGGDGIDACFGDSGGPLYLLTDRGDFVVGVTSRALAGASFSFPCRDGGIWVRPDAAIDWIEQRAGNRQIVFPSSCNEPPEVEVDDIVTEVDVPGTARVAVQDPDGPNLGATVRVVARPDHGEVEVDGADLVYTPDPGYVGEDAFTVEITDAGVAGMPRTGGPVSVEADVGVVVQARGAGDGTAGGGDYGSGDGAPLESDVAYVAGCTCTTPAAGTAGWLVLGILGLVTARRR
jgi:uncharacterized protein (TIGR03382 family)